MSNVPAAHLWTVYAALESAIGNEAHGADAHSVPGTGEVLPQETVESCQMTLIISPAHQVKNEIIFPSQYILQHSTVSYRHVRTS